MQSEIDSITPAPGLTPQTSVDVPAAQVDSNKQANDLIKSMLDEEEKTLNDFNHARIYLNSLISEWRMEEQVTEANRLTRDIEINVDALRESGEIDDDECFIPERIIDNNIQREMPSYINFLKNSRRIATFTDTLDETFDTDLLEQAFTKGMTYKGWTKPHFKVIDGSMTHGWASMEVVYDEKYPLNCGLEYIAHEDFLFATDSKDIQASSCVLRRYRLTPLQLKSFVANFGFDVVQTDQLIERFKNSQIKDKTIEVFKRYCKYQGAVYASWFSIQSGTSDWLKKPAKLYAGIDELKTVVENVPTQQPMMAPDNVTIIGYNTVNVPTPTQKFVPSDVVNFPIFLLPFRETEKPLVFDHFGRVFYDKDKQEAQTAILTAFVNRMNRSQKVFGSPGVDTVNDGKPAKQLANTQLADGTIWDKPFQFWEMPPPDPGVLKALQYMDDSNSEDIGQTNYATINREDSRKTATEISASEKTQQLLDSVDLTLYSEFIREVYSFAWLIVQSQALQSKIKFLLVKPEQPQMQQMGMGQPQQQQPNQSIVNSLGTYQQEISSYQNDYDTIARKYDIRAAGDVDVIQKQEMIASMMQDWPVIQNTPLAARFLSDLIKLKYPQDSGMYSDILLGGSPKNAIIQSLGSLLQKVVSMPEVAQHLTPQDKQGLLQMQQEAQQALQTP